MSNTYAYDVETFPNLFTMIASNVDEDFDEYIFVIGFGRDDREQIKEFVKGKTLVGFNNVYFDNVILNAVLAGKKPIELYQLAQKIVEGGEDIGPEIYRFRTMPNFYKSIDLMAIWAFDKARVSLKVVSILLKWHRVQESDLPFDKEVKKEDLNKVLEYNSNDVSITKELYYKSKEVIDLRIGLSKLYNADVINASDSKIANILLKKMYSERTGLRPENFNLLSSPRDILSVSDCIVPCVSFESKEMQDFLEEIKKIEMTKNPKFDFKKSITIGNKRYDIGTGGLHSSDKEGIFESVEGREVWDADATSYYIKLILNYKIKPDHLRDEYFDIVEEIVEERIRAKKRGDEIKAGGMKILVLSFFGKTNSEHSWLYDPKAFYTVTISGQLCLLMLVERLNLQGIEVLSVNTDGITCIVEDKGKYKEVCERWERDTGIFLEYEKYLKYIRKDVNNYISVLGNGKVKKKGFFLDEIKITKGYESPIIPKSVANYFLKGIPVEETIMSSKDIHDFFIFEKTDKKFQLKFKNGHGIENIQRVSRFYASIEGGELYKTNGERNTCLLAGVGVKILNDIPINSSFEDFKVDSKYYIQKAKEIVNKIESVKSEQLSLW